MKLTNSMIVACSGLTCLLILGYRGLDVSTAIVGIVTAYVGARSAQKATAIYSASKDENCNTAEIIDKLKG